MHNTDLSHVVSRSGVDKGGGRGDAQLSAYTVLNKKSELMLMRRATASV